jgi:acyl-CoA oxidase
LGHGSDVSGIETTATYEPESECFILNTPSPTATKWWSGDNYMFSNHAIVIAKLIVKGKSKGT